ncbi:hypothetical protein [Trinickia dinghuensis]|nr:hypothetical protein [Trinickia dinghuensis]
MTNDRTTTGSALPLSELTGMSMPYSPAAAVRHALLAAWRGTPRAIAR